VSADEIVIGIHAPVTGASPIPQTSFDIGKDIYWKFVAANLPDKLFGRNVRVVFRDDEFNPNQAVSVCREMVEPEGAFLLVGGGGADQITACARCANDNGIPYLSAGVNETGLADLSTYFAATMTYSEQAPLLIARAQALGLTQVGLLVTDTPSFDDAREAIITLAGMCQRSSGSFELRVFIGVDPDPVRRRYRSMTVRANRADAERELASMVAAVRAERSVGVRSTVSELLEAWFAIASTGWAPTTIRQTRSVLDRYLQPHLGHVAVGDVTPAGIDAVYATLRRGGGVRQQSLSAGTIARCHVVLRSAFAQAMRWGWTWDNPAERAHRVIATSAELRPPTPQELSRLLDHVRDLDAGLHVFLFLAALTGARRAQLLGLRWHNVHSRRAGCRSAQGWVEGPDGPVLTTTKTKRSHVVDLDPDSFAVPAEFAEGAATGLEGFVFSNDGGITAWKPNKVTKTFLRHRRAAGLRPFRLHDLRHFMATEMLHAGVPIVTVSRRLDHRRVSTTLDKYAHAVPGGDARASATLHSIISAATRTSSGGDRSPSADEPCVQGEA